MQAWLALALATLASPCAPAERASAPAAPQSAAAPRAEERVELAEVVDGDTLHVRRAGKVAKLRVLCVDTEERFHPGLASSPGKPQTVFGEETALWAEQLFAGFAREGRPVELRLRFPGGRA